MMSGQFRTITMFFMLPQYFLVDFSKVYNNGCIWWHKHGNFTIYDNVVHIYAYASGHTEDIFDLRKLNPCLLKSLMFSVKCIFMLLEMLSKVKKLSHHWCASMTGGKWKNCLTLINCKIDFFKAYYWLIWTNCYKRKNYCLKSKDGWISASFVF